MALHAGQPALAHDVADAVEAAAARAGTATYRGSARRCRGLVDGDVGAARGRRHHADSPRMVDRAGTMEDAAAALLPGDPEAGADLLEEALAGFEAAGATRDASRVRAGLRGAGRRRQRPSAPAAPGAGWADLSPTERRVVALVAEGHSNREVADRLFLSRRTVDNHLYRVFTKLEVANRVELSLRVRSWGQTAGRP